MALRRVFKLPSDNQLTFRFIGQYSNDFLPIGRDLSLGGAYAIRGYTEGLINGDRGVFGSVEHQWPVPGLGKISSKSRQSIRGVTFFDIGQAWLDNTNTRFRQGLSNDVNRTLLASIGVGLRFRVTQYLQGFVDAGYGLFDRNLVEIASQPSVRVHFGFRSDLLPQPMVEHLAHHHMLFNRSSLHDQ